MIVVLLLSVLAAGAWIATSLHRRGPVATRRDATGDFSRAMTAIAPGPGRRPSRPPAPRQRR